MFNDYNSATRPNRPKLYEGYMADEQAKQQRRAQEFNEAVGGLRLYDSMTGDKTPIADTLRSWTGASKAANAENVATAAKTAEEAKQAADLATTTAGTTAAGTGTAAGTTAAGTTAAGTTAAGTTAAGTTAAGTTAAGTGTTAATTAGASNPYTLIAMAIAANEIDARGNENHNYRDDFGWKDYVGGAHRKEDLKHRLPDLFGNKDSWEEVTGSRGVGNAIDKSLQFTDFSKPLKKLF
jgi:hypothetical protein